MLVHDGVCLVHPRPPAVGNHDPQVGTRHCDPVYADWAMQFETRTGRSTPAGLDRDDKSQLLGFGINRQRSLIVNRDVV